MYYKTKPVSSDELEEVLLESETVELDSTDVVSSFAVTVTAL